MAKKYAMKVKYDPAADLHLMHKIWKETTYNPNDIAFRIRAIVLARIECKIYHQEQGEET